MSIIEKHQKGETSPKLKNSPNLNKLERSRGSD